MNKIQKLTLLIAVVLCTAFSANAGLRFGIKAGLNINSLHFNKEKLIDSDNRCGWTGGVMMEYMLPVTGIGFDLSAMYTRMNAEVKYGNNNIGYGYQKVGKNFIEIPLNVKYKLSLPAVSNIIKPYIYTGPSFAFKCGKNTLNDFKTKTCQVAWNLGLGIELIKHLQIQASYGFGINNVAKYADDINTVNDIKAKNNYWTITAAYLF